jgi:hypothetical protein
VLRRSARLAAASLLLGALTSCSTAPKELHLDINTGHETDTFSMDPPVTRLTISAKSPDGSTALIATAFPGGTFDLGDVVETQSLGFEVAGYDALGHLVVRGRSLGAISLLSTGKESTIPVFVQRVGQWARPSGELERAHVGAPTGVLAEQYVWQSGGKAYDEKGEASATSSDFYDLFAQEGATGPTFERAPETIVSFGSAAMVFDQEAGTSIDFSAQTKGDLTLPEGLGSFAEIAGGTPIYDEDGTAYVVGATRSSGEPTSAVLIITSNGTLSATKLSTPRLGAAAAWVPSFGLMVAGGSDMGAGVEVLPYQTTTFIAGGYAPDAVVGAAAVLDPRDATNLKMFLVGGSDAGGPAATRLIDLNCSTACAVTELPELGLPIALHRGAGYVLSNSQIIAVGDEPSSDGPGETHSFVLDVVGGVVSEPKLREPRRGATTIPSPLGTLALLGGLHLDGTPALTIESFFPP